MTPETATTKTFAPDQDFAVMPEEKEGTVLQFPANRRYEEALSEGDGSRFNSPVFPTAEVDADMEEFRTKMGQLNVRLATSRKVDNVFRRW